MSKSLTTETQLTKRRIIEACLVIVLVFIGLTIRMAFLQVAEYETYRAQSDNNRILSQALPPMRGEILDRNGVPIAINRPVKTLQVTKDRFKDADTVLATLASIIDLSPSEQESFRQEFSTTRHPHEPITIKYDLTEEEEARIASHAYWLSEFDVATELVRYYPFSELTGHLIGYVNRINRNDLERIDPQRYKNTQHIGRTGLEQYYEEHLHGFPGFRQVEKDANNYIHRELESQPAVAGKPLKISIDIKLQQLAHEAMGDRRGSVVAIDTETGGILTFVSTPSFDPNAFVNGISQTQYNAYRDDIDTPLFNRALRGQYPPASTIKPMVGLALLEHSIVDWSTSIFDKGWYQVNEKSRFYRDWKRTGHGTVDLDHAIAQSCDTYFYEFGYELGINRMSEFLGQFNLGRPTGIDLFGEKPGVLASRDYKKTRFGQPWYIGDTIISSIGQGYMLATPIQLAHFTQLIANSGRAITPHLALNQQLQSKQQVQYITLKDPKDWEKMHVSMNHVIDSSYGTARGLRRDATVRMAGKSGTAQVKSLPQPDEPYSEDELTERHKDHALFIAFAPLDAPKIAVSVIIENGESGSGAAGPVAKKVIEAYLASQEKTSEAQKPTQVQRQES
ncbi:MAG: penicillin-binding protein 2 [Pseudomonadota bacterium]|nr:penicillin-binding protein 2 [Pseudomonadota bacterium]